MRSASLSILAAAAATILAGALAACSSSGGAGSTPNPTGNGSVSVSVPVVATPPVSASASATLTAGHCVLYSRTEATALIGTPNMTIGLPQLAVRGGTKIDSCMYDHVDIAARSAKLLGYGAVRFSGNAMAASAGQAALRKAEASASDTPREFPAPGLPAGTRDAVWHASAPHGVASITVAAVTSNVGKYVVWADGGGTVSTQRAEQIALTVAQALVRKVGG